MWETTFDESMLGFGKNLIVNCPDKSLSDELMEIFERNGIRWGGGESPVGCTMWKEHGEGTCYWVEGRYLSYESKAWAEEYYDEDYSDHVCCTYRGDAADFEAATDTELMSFLGIGGAQ